MARRPFPEQLAEGMCGTCCRRARHTPENEGYSDCCDDRIEYGSEARSSWEAWEDERALAEHDCADHAVPYASAGALGHGWECGRCGAFLQAG
jgi:hypothetical protein